MRFIYFIPGLKQQLRSSLIELHNVGAKHVDIKSNFSSNYTTSGPGGEPGALVAIGVGGENASPPFYKPESQVWRKHFSGKYWVGYNKGEKPTSGDLVRKTVLEGAIVEIDGEEWKVPICIHPQVEGMSGFSLPQRFDLTDDNEIKGVVIEKYADVSDRCFEYFQFYMGSIAAETDEQRFKLFNDHVQLSVDILSINYEIDRFEAIAMLGLLDTTNFRDPINAAIEVKVINDYVAKKMEEIDSAVAPKNELTFDESGTSTGSIEGTTQTATPSDSAIQNSSGT